MNYNNKYIYDIRVTFDVNVSRKKHAISFAKSNPLEHADSNTPLIIVIVIVSGSDSDST